MENYLVVEKLGKGAQGNVFLVEHQTTKSKFVLKQIECCDESEANKAYREALVLAELKHPYICSYKEFFVTWEKEVSAMNLGMVVSYYPGGSLAKVLQNKRDKQEKLDEEELKRWLGQILEALMFSHSKKIIHRDLKPSNVYLHDDESLCVGDFSVATVMTDVRTKSRTTVGSMNWMAPEVLEKEYDERSDVWSLGCVVAEMATCAGWDAAQMAGRLLEIKHNDQALQELLEQIALNYSEELVSVVRVMLNRNYRERPTAKALADIPYIKECLDLSNFVLIERKHRQQTLASQRPVPQTGGCQAVIDYLLTYMNNESCVRQGMLQLIDLAREDDGLDGLDPTSKRVIAKAMKDYLIEADIQQAGCKILSNLLISASPDDILYSAEIISVLPLVMQTHHDSSSVLQSVACLLAGLSANAMASGTIGNLGCLREILQAMRAFPNDAELLATCCNALWSLTVNEDNTRLATEHKAVQEVLQVLQTHQESAELVQNAFAVLLSLSVEDENLDVMNHGDSVGLILDAMQYHMNQPKVVKNACMALAAIVEPEEECAYRVLANPRVGSQEEVQGLPILVRAYEQHKDNAEVVENLCTLLMELVEYDDLCWHIKYTDLPHILQVIRSRYLSNKDIMAPCEAALSKLGGGRIQLQTGPTKA